MERYQNTQKSQCLAMSAAESAKNRHINCTWQGRWYGLITECLLLHHMCMGNNRDGATRVHNGNQGIRVKAVCSAGKAWVLPTMCYFHTYQLSMVADHVPPFMDTIFPDNCGHFQTVWGPQWGWGIPRYQWIKSGMCWTNRSEPWRAEPLASKLKQSAANTWFVPKKHPDDHHSWEEALLCTHTTKNLCPF